MYFSDEIHSKARLERTQYIGELIADLIMAVYRFFGGKS